MKTSTQPCTVSLPLLEGSHGITENVKTKEEESKIGDSRSQDNQDGKAANLIRQNDDTKIQKQEKGRYRLIYTIVLYASFLAFALCRNMYGPTLVELQIITGSNIDQISTVFTWLGAGGITGSLAYGFLYDRFPTAPILVTTLGLLCIVTCLIPMFQYIVIMMVLCAMQAFLFNGISIGCNVTILHLWGNKSTSLLLGMHVLYTIGGFIVPLLSEPFMTSRQNCPFLNTSRGVPCLPDLPQGNISHLTVNYSQTVTSDSLSTDTVTSANLPSSAVLCNQLTLPSNLTDVSKTSNSLCKSQIKHVYLIIGLYAGIVAVLNGVAYWRSAVKLEIIKGVKRRETTRRVNRKLTVLTYVLFVMFNFCFGGQEMTFSGLLFTFTTEHVGMSTIEGSLLVSALFACYGLGRLGGMIIAKFVTPRALLLVDLACGAIAAFFLAYFTVKSSLAIWVCTIVGGIALSTVFCSALIWARDFVPVGGRFTSVYVIAYTTGMMTWPPLTGFLVRERGPQWFPYINLLLVIGCLLFYSCLVGLRLVFKKQMTQPIITSTLPSNGHLQINRKLIFTSFHGSLPHLQADLKIL